MLEVVGSPVGRASRLDRTTLAFRRGRSETGRVTGEPDRIDLLERLAGKAVVDDPRSLALPKDMAAFEIAKDERIQLVQRLLDEGRHLVEEVERLVCALYDLPHDLTEAVVEHAVRRAGGANGGDID